MKNKQKEGYLSDEMYLPIHYKGIIVQEPFYQGDGIHSVTELQELCKQFKEYVHQQQVIKQNCMQRIVELKFGIQKDLKETKFERTKEGLKEYQSHIGITDLIEAQKELRSTSNGTKGKYWMALSPKWVEDEEMKVSYGTKYDILYWVNYGDNSTHGWFTVEQISKWLKDPELKLYTLGGTKER